jgi:anti-sigma B factor antagonist
MHSSPELRRVLMLLIEKKTSPLVVDVSEVSYIDSSGIATFVEGLKKIAKYKGSLKLTGMQKGVMDIFSFAKLDRVFEIYGSIDDALKR